MEGCPGNTEVERPQNLMEMVSSENSWRELGFRIKWTEPPVPSSFSMTLGEPLRLRVAVEAKRDISDSQEELAAFCWTNVRFTVRFGEFRVAILPFQADTVISMAVSTICPPALFVTILLPYFT